MNYSVLADLVDRAKQGDTDAFAQLYNILSKPVYYTAFKVAKNKEDANDILQETMITLYQTLATVEDSQAILKYATTISYRLCKRMMDKKKTHLQDQIEDTLEHQVETIEAFIPEQAVLSKEQQSQMMQHIDRLSESHRMVIMMHYYSDMSVKEISEILQISEGTVKSRLSRARELLKKSLEGANKNLVRCIMATSVLAQVLHANAEEVFANDIRIANWESISASLNLSAEAAISAAEIVAAGATLATGSTTAAATSATGIGAKVLSAIFGTNTAVTYVAIGTICTAILAGGGFAVYQAVSNTLDINTPSYIDMTQDESVLLDIEIVLDLTADAYSHVSESEGETLSEENTPLDSAYQNTQSTRPNESADSTSEISAHNPNITEPLPPTAMLPAPDISNLPPIQTNPPQNIPDIPSIPDTSYIPSDSQLPPNTPALEVPSLPNSPLPPASQPPTAPPPPITPQPPVIPSPPGQMPPSPPRPPNELPYDWSPIVVQQRSLIFTAGQTVTEAQILTHAGISTLNIEGRIFDIRLLHFDTIDFSVSGRHAISAQAIDEMGNVLAQIVIVITVE